MRVGLLRGAGNVVFNRRIVHGRAWDLRIWRWRARRRVFGRRTGAGHRGVVAAPPEDHGSVLAASHRGRGAQTGIGALDVVVGHVRDRLTHHLMVAGNTHRRVGLISVAGASVEVTGSFLVPLGFRDVAHVVQRESILGGELVGLAKVVVGLLGVVVIDG